MTETIVYTEAGRIRDRLGAEGLDVEACELIVAEALDEDLGGRGVLPSGWHGPRVDVTSVATVPAGATATGEVVARAAGTVAGVTLAALVFASTAGDRPFTITVLATDGERVERGRVLLRVEGDTRAVLTAERTALNLISLVSGTATAARAWVDALAGTGARVRDSRKTVPGLRMLQKYAVRVAGGVNHRMALSDAALIKDNHVIAAGGVVAAYRAVRAQFPGLPVQVEATTAAQVDELVAAGATDILLDNMTVSQMAAIVSAHREHGRAEVGGDRGEVARIDGGEDDRHPERRIVFEASGGLTVESALAVAGTGVDFLAVGAITHSATILDIALDLTLDLSLD